VRAVGLVAVSFVVVGLVVRAVHDVHLSRLSFLRCSPYLKYSTLTRARRRNFNLNSNSNSNADSIILSELSITGVRFKHCRGILKVTLVLLALKI
jgi:hypothetical protein